MWRESCLKTTRSEPWQAEEPLPAEHGRAEDLEWEVAVNATGVAGDGIPLQTEGVVAAVVEDGNERREVKGW